MTQHGEMKKDIVFFSLVVLSTLGNAQSTLSAFTGRYTSLSAYSKTFADVLSFTSNQAALGNVKTAGAAVYAEKKFLLKEMNYYTIAACLPIQFGGIGISAKYFGYDAYKETQLSVSYGKNLGQVNIGFQANYYGVSIPGYGKEALLTIEGGAILQLSEQLYTGLHIFNPTGSKFGEGDRERLRSAYTAGIAYEVSEKVLLSASMLKEEDKSVDVNAGLQYVFSKKFFARLGLFTGTANVYFGAGWRWTNFRVDITSSYHNQLGFTPGLMLLIQGNKVKE